MHTDRLANGLMYLLGFLLMLAGGIGTFLLLGFAWWSWADQFHYVAWSFDVPGFALTLSLIATGFYLVSRSLKRTSANGAKQS